MGTPFTPAITLPSSLSLLAPDARSQPSGAEKLQAAVYQHVLQSDPPGWWAADKSAQLSHYSGVVSIAAKAYLDAIGGARFVVSERKVASKFLKSGSASGIYARDDEYEPADPDCPLCKVIEEPGGEDGAWSIHQECGYLTLQHVLTGDAPAWTPVNAAGKPVRFFALTSALVQPQYRAGIDPRYPKGAYRVVPYGQAFYAGGQLGTFAILPGEEVKRFREFHPWSRNLGMSRLESGAKEIDVLEAITASRWAYFDGGLQLDFVAMLPGADKSTVEAFQKQMQQKSGGSRNARRFLAIGGPSITEKWQLQTFGQSARDLDFANGYDQSAGIALAMFRVPKGIAGFTSQTSYAQHYAELQQFWDLGIIPYCRALSVFLTQSLAKPWSTRPSQYRIEVEAQKPKDVEMASRTTDTGLQSGAIDVNEWRKANDWPAKPDGDAPIQVYLAKQQQAIAPDPMAGGMPGGAPGGMPPGMEGDPQAEGEDQTGDDQGDDSPEATQDSATSAALAMLGVPAENDALAKALPPPTKAGTRQARREGEVWQVGGTYYTKKNGKIHETAAPGGTEAKPPFPRHVGRTTPPPLPADYLAKLKTSPTPPPIPTAHVARHAASVPASTPQAKQTLASVQQWAKAKADQHADKVAAHFGVSRERAHAILVHAITAVAQHAAKTGGRGASGTMSVGGKKLKVSLPGKTGEAPTGGRPPAPANPDGAGSKPPFPRHAKALPREWTDPAPYGYCPECREPGICCERRIGGNAQCGNGHSYPRKKAKYASTQIELTGKAARKLLAMARQISDADLGDDGREGEPHVTARYGLHVDDPAAVAEVVNGFGPVRVRIGQLNAFRGAESGKDYDVIFAEVDSPDLHRLNAALAELPHTDTHPVYKPHATVAYVKAGLADKYLATLGRVDESATIDRLTFSTAKREHTEIPLTLAKAGCDGANTLTGSAGGFLVEPGTTTRRKKKRRSAAVVARVMKALEE